MYVAHLPPPDPASFCPSVTLPFRFASLSADSIFSASSRRAAAPPGITAARSAFCAVRSPSFRACTFNRKGTYLVF